MFSARQKTYTSSSETYTECRFLKKISKAQKPTLEAIKPTLSVGSENFFLDPLFSTLNHQKPTLSVEILEN